MDIYETMEKARAAETQKRLFDAAIQMMVFRLADLAGAAKDPMIMFLMEVIQGKVNQADFLDFLEALKAKAAAEAPATP